jgi:hypothetical protein
MDHIINCNNIQQRIQLELQKNDYEIDKSLTRSGFNDLFNFIENVKRDKKLVKQLYKYYPQATEYFKILK